ncbi:MAG: hypothetical protein JNK78_05600 [Planctomycetes bacterium]|nr:hypothetical protein [Planctomycetota bacterium]
MNPHEEVHPFSEEMKQLLTRAIPPLPLDEARVHSTVMRAEAGMYRLEGGGRPQRRWIAPLVGVGIAVVVAVAAWKWNPQRSEASPAQAAQAQGAQADEFSYATGIEAIRDAASTPKGVVHRALAAINQDTKRVLAELQKRGAYSDEIRVALLDALRGPAPTAPAPERGNAAIRAKVMAGTSLTPEETAVLIDDLRVAIRAIRSVRDKQPPLEKSIDLMCRYLTEDAERPNGDVTSEAPGTGGQSQ